MGVSHSFSLVIIYDRWATRSKRCFVASRKACRLPQRLRWFRGYSCSKPPACNANCGLQAGKAEVFVCQTWLFGRHDILTLGFKAGHQFP